MAQRLPLKAATRLICGALLAIVMAPADAALAAGVQAAQDRPAPPLPLAGTAGA